MLLQFRKSDGIILIKKSKSISIVTYLDRKKLQVFSCCHHRMHAFDVYDNDPLHVANHYVNKLRVLIHFNHFLNYGEKFTFLIMFATSWFTTAIGVAPLSSIGPYKAPGFAVNLNQFSKLLLELRGPIRLLLQTSHLPNMSSRLALSAFSSLVVPLWTFLLLIR